MAVLEGHAFQPCPRRCGSARLLPCRLGVGVHAGCPASVGLKGHGFSRAADSP